MKKIFQFLHPPEDWRLVAAIVTGAIIGMGMYLFVVSNAVSYVSDAPETCINCHIMSPQYATWQHSAHREKATCNDCHVPHTNPVATYYFKGKDGMRHATIFTLRAEPQVIKIGEEGKKVVQENCKRCHKYLNEIVGTLAVTLESAKHGEGKLCWECHREVPHGRVNSLSSVSYTQIPKLESPVPVWITKLLKNEKSE